MHFCDVQLSLGEKHTLTNACFKQHAFSVDPLGVWYDFRIFKLSCFRPQKGGTNPRKKVHLECHFSKLSSQNTQNPFQSQKWAPKRPIPNFWRRPKGPKLADHPVCAKDITVSNESVVSSVLDNGFSRFLCPTPGIQDIVSKPAGHVDSNFVVQLCNVAGSLARVLLSMMSPSSADDASLAASIVMSTPSRSPVWSFAAVRHLKFYSHRCQILHCTALSSCTVLRSTVLCRYCCNWCPTEVQNSASLSPTPASFVSIVAQRETTPLSSRALRYHDDVVFMTEPIILTVRVNQCEYDQRDKHVNTG